jgi:sialate O-acetylesterase
VTCLNVFVMTCPIKIFVSAVDLSIQKLRGDVMKIMVFVVLLSTALLFGAAARELTISTGLADYQVYQRDANDKTDIRFTGTCSLAGAVQLRGRVLDSHLATVVLDWQNAGTIKSRNFTATIIGVPVGGPYNIEVAAVRSSDETVAALDIQNVLVGDLWILAGQSNMQGVGELDKAETPSILVNSYGYDERWIVASEPLHWLLDSIDPVHQLGLTGKALTEARLGMKKGALAGTGLGLPFAKTLALETKVPIGLVPCAHGGTSMEQWDPGKKETGGQSLYGSMYRRFVAVGGKVKGVLWYQGESDASPTAAPLYSQRMQNLVQSIRRDFNAPNLPFYYVQLGRFCVSDDNGYWNDIREQQRLLLKSIPNSGMVAAIDLELDDLIHVGTDGLKRLGRRLANQVLREQFGRHDLLSGPELDGVTLIPFRFSRFRLSFAHVNGALSSYGRPNGFSIRDTNGRDLHLIYKTTLTENGRYIDLFLRETPPAGAMLWYGYGLDPVCTITDSRDMSLPTFGPLAIDPVVYASFVNMAKENPQSGQLSVMWPQVFATARKDPDRQKELLPLINRIIEQMKPTDQLQFAPYQFALSHFNQWDAYVKKIGQLSLAERKQWAQAWRAAVQFPSLSCPFVKQWQVAGSFDNAGDKFFDKKYSPESDPSLTAVYKDGLHGPVRWQAAQADEKGYLDFLKLLPVPENAIVYAQAHVESQREAEVLLLLGSDDAAALWVNGKEVHRAHQHRSALPGSDLMMVKLVKGHNDILIKVDQEGGDWGLYVQLVDKDGILKY